MNPSSNLIEAIDRRDMEGLRRLMAAGANPYEEKLGEKSPAQVWLESQPGGNFCAIEMGRELLKRKPANPDDERVLNGLVEGQVARLAQSLGEAEFGNAEGIAVDISRTTAQTLEEAQGCWGVVRKAYTDFWNRHPMVQPNLYADNLTRGMATAAALLVKEGANYSLRDAPAGRMYFDPPLWAGIKKDIETNVYPYMMTVLPSGAVASVGRDSVARAACFRSQGEIVPAADHFAEAAPPLLGVSPSYIDTQDFGAKLHANRTARSDPAPARGMAAARA